MCGSMRKAVCIGLARRQLNVTFPTPSPLFFAQHADVNPSQEHFSQAQQRGPKDRRTVICLVDEMDYLVTRDEEVGGLCG